MLKQFFSSRTQSFKQITALTAILIVAIVGTILLTGSHASTPYISLNADKGTLTNGATSQTCNGASDGNCVKFGASGSGAGCTTKVSSVAAAVSAVSSAANGATVCMATGSYGSISLSGNHTANVTFEPDPSLDPNGSGKVTFSGINISGKFITVHNFYSTNGISVNNGSSNDTVDHNDVTAGPGGGGVGVSCDATPCSAITFNGNRIHNLTGTPGSGAPPNCNYGSDGDAIRLDGWKSITDASGNVITPGVTVTNNEVTGIEQLQTSSLCEGHTDCLQSYNAVIPKPTSTISIDIVFNNNYEHDNNCQGFFLKDSVITSAKLTDNLFLRSVNEGMGEANIQIFDTQTVTMDHNTSWSGGGDLVRSNTAGYQATVKNSVLQTAIQNGCGSCSDGKLPYTLTQSNNITGGNPGFLNTATDDYRLASNPNNVGIDWAPASQHYGPIK